jgi:hypothetical protein
MGRTRSRVFIEQSLKSGHQLKDDKPDENCYFLELFRLSFNFG